MHAGEGKVAGKEISKEEEEEKEEEESRSGAREEWAGSAESDLYVCFLPQVCCKAVRGE